jgi:hypothetical protein
VFKLFNDGALLSILRPLHLERGQRSPFTLFYLNLIQRFRCYLAGGLITMKKANPGFSDVI